MQDSLTATDKKELIVRERRAAALAFLELRGEVTAAEIAAELKLSNAAGTISHMYRAGLIKDREISTKDTYGNRIKLYSLLHFAGPWREYTGEHIRPFLLAQYWPGCPEHLPTKEERMSVFTELEIQRNDDSSWRVTMARPWWKPNYRHETHCIHHTPETATLYLRLPFYDSSRPRIDEVLQLETYLNDYAEETCGQ